MNTRAIAGAYLIALAWFLYLPFYATPLVGWALGTAVAGGMIFARFVDSRELPARAAGVPAIVGVGLASLMLPAPWSIGLWAILAGQVLSRLRANSPLGARIVSLGLLLTAQVAVLATLRLFTTGGGSLPHVDWLTATSAPVAGLPTVSGVDQVSIDVGQRLQPVTSTFDSTGLSVLTVMILPLFLHPSLGLRAKARIAGVTLLYGVARHAALLAVCLLVGGATGRLLTLPIVLLASFTPLVLVLLFARRQLGSETGSVTASDARGGPTLRRTLAAVSCVIAVGAIAVLGRGWVDAGPEKQGRIVVDDSHGGWEPGSLPHDLSDFGTDSVYNYTLMWEWLGHHYPLEIHTEGTVTEELLASADVFVVKTPTFPYTAEERAAIDAFIRRGGGLFVIGDHTDVFGMTTVLNDVVRPYGFTFGRDVGVIVDQIGVGNYRYQRDDFAANPITRMMDDGIDFMGSCTINVHCLDVDFAITSDAQAIDPADFRDSSFFGDTDATLDDAIQPFVSCVAKKVGDGRVLLWSDSTIFSNFAMFEPGKTELVLGITDYLNRTNATSASVKTWMRVATPALLALALLLLGTSPAPLQIAMYASGSVAVVVTGAATHLVQDRVYDVERPGAGPAWIGIDGIHGEAPLYDMPVAGDRRVEQSARGGPWEAVFSAIPRVTEAFPRVVTDYDQLDELDTLLVLSPTREFTDRELEQLQSAVTNGLKVVVFASAADVDSTSEQILSFSNLRFQGRLLRDPRHTEIKYTGAPLASATAAALGPLDQALILANWERSMAPGRPTGHSGVEILSVQGGTPYWSTGPRAIPVLMGQPIGEGAVFAFAGATWLSYFEMGSTSEALLQQDPQLASYRLFEALLARVRRTTPSTQGRGGHAGHAHGAHAGHGHEGHAHGPQGAELTAVVEAQILVDIPGTEPDAAPPEAAELVDDLATAHAEHDRAIELLRHSILQRQTEFGTTRARVVTYLKTATQICFASGYALADADRGFLQLIGNDGTGQLTTDHHGHPPPGVDLHVTRGATRWLRPDRGAAVVVRHDGLDAGTFLRVPERWLDAEWRVVRSTTESPRAALEDIPETTGTQTLGTELIETSMEIGRLPAENWSESLDQTEYWVLRSEDDFELAGGWLGHVELWLEHESLRIRKLRAGIRRRGRTGTQDWYDLVTYFDHYSQHPDAFLPDRFDSMGEIVLDGPELWYLRGDHGN